MRLISLFICSLFLGCGSNAKDGVDGEAGTPGAAGADGVDGATGADGADGMDGESGEDGEDGLDCWDTNGDGSPNPEEDVNGDGVVNVDDCSPDGDGGGRVYLGDLTIRELDQAAYFCDHYNTVLGSLSIEPWSYDLSELSCLRSVSQDLTIDGGTMTAVSLPNLETVGGEFFIQATYSSEVRFVSLTSTSGLEIDQTGIFSGEPLVVSFPSLLESLSSSPFAVTSSGMQELDFSNLTLVEGDLKIEDNASLLHLDGLERLAVVSGNLEIRGNDALCETLAWDAIAAVSIGGSTTIIENTGTCP